MTWPAHFAIMFMLLITYGAVVEDEKGKYSPAVNHTGAFLVIGILLFFLYCGGAFNG